MSLAEARVLVTGARGFIGAHLVRRLGVLGAQVHAVSRQQPAAPAPSLIWWQCDLTDPEQVATLVRRVAPDVVLHLASEVASVPDPQLVLPMFHGNLASVVHLLGAALETPGLRVVLAGSMEEPGPGEAPSSPYAAAKAAATGYADMFHHLWQLPVTTLRVTRVYGPEQPDLVKLVPYVITSVIEGRPPELRNGHREMDWVYVEDAVAAFVAAAEVPGAAGATLDIGSGNAVSIRDMVARVIALVGGDIEPRYGMLTDGTQEAARIADLAPAGAVLGWRPVTSLDTGLAHTVRWYVENRRHWSSPLTCESR